MLDGSARRFVVHSRLVIAKIIDHRSQRRGNFGAPAMVVIGAEAQGGVGDMRTVEDRAAGTATSTDLGSD